jgi:serine protease DegQ
MRCCWPAFTVAFLCPGLGAQADEAAKPGPKPILVPYRLTAAKHVLIRAKIDGKGPFNFILDTGAPAAFISRVAAAKVGAKADPNGWADFNRFELEGGLVVASARARVEDISQLEAINRLGLADVEIHGILGYGIVARYRIEYDFTSDKLAWTPLDFDPPAPTGAGVRTGSAGLEAVGRIVRKLDGGQARRSPADVAFRGYMGLDAGDKDDVVTVRAVLPDCPAAAAGVKPGDRIKKVNDRTVLSVADLERLARRLKAGDEVTLTVERAGKTLELRFNTAEGL